MTIIRRNNTKDDRQPRAGTQQWVGNQQRETPFFENPDYAEEELGCWTPAAEIIDRDDAIVLTLELPGLGREDIRVDIDNGILSVNGKREAPEENESSRRILRAERCYGSFCRSFSLNNQIDQEKIAATMEKGLLTLTLPYREEAKPKHVEIKIN